MYNDEVFLGLPNTGHIRVELMSWIIRSRIKHICPVQLKPHDACRNMIVNYFLQTDLEWLMMIDSDVVPVTDILQMVANDVPVCSAHVSICKGREIIPIGMTKDSAGGYFHEFKHSDPSEAPYKVDAVGTGCILIHRDVFEAIDKPFFRFVYDENGMIINGEDFDFCERVYKFGGEVYFDPRQKANHFTTLAI